jgi:hypothetical protein
MMEATPLSEAKRRLLARYIQDGCTQATPPSIEVTKRSEQSSAPLSWAQEEVWDHVQRMPDTACYNEAIAIHRRGPLDVHVLRESFFDVVRRHEAWRTTFDVVDGIRIQRIHPQVAIEFPFNDLRGIASSERETTAVILATKDLREPFNLCRGPLLRPRLVQLDDEYFRLYLGIHQIVLDGVSVYHIFLPELVHFYEARSSHKPARMVPLHLHYADFAYWQRSLDEDKMTEPDLAYWRQVLGREIEVLQLPTDYRRPAQQTFHGEIFPFKLPIEISQHVRSLSQREGVTVFTALFTAFATLFHRYTRQLDITLGTVAPAGRELPQAQRVIGYLLNRIPLRADLTGDPTISELLARSRWVVSSALSHDNVPFARLVQHFQPTPDASRNPFFQYMISLEPPMPRVSPGWDLTPMDLQSGGARMDLYLVLDERPTGMLGRAQYNPDLFTEKTIARLVNHFQSTLEAIIANPELRLSEMIPLQLIQ